MATMKTFINTLGLILLFLYPAIVTGTAVTLEFLPGLTYTLGKGIMIAIPVIVWIASRKPRRQVFAEAGLRATNGLRGLLSGGVLTAAIVTGYFLFFKGSVDPSGVMGKLQSLGLLRYYWLMAVFISLWNSFMEEFYWRAFLFGLLKARVKSGLTQCLVNGALFGAHHFLVLITVFPLSQTLMFTFATMVAGAVWSWHRARGHSVIDCYVSHVLADLAIMWVGWDLIS